MNEPKLAVRVMRKWITGVVLFCCCSTAFSQSFFNQARLDFLETKWATDPNAIEYVDNITVHSRTVEWWLYAETRPVYESYEATMIHRWMVADLAQPHSTFVGYHSAKSDCPYVFDIQVKVGPIETSKRPVKRRRGYSFYELIQAGK
ncbi:MAG: hypothetical protein Unbinned400contig1000_35 [Prokaryotic dsDNA virus sp.]|nr:MAG: hypothetical protein Unbinned400contig1000_35 [Prokaryotic dsDNA virus sp.]|tara:strand:- start:3748 stop:4188 length:441 start_codon:yes stop_codon:yes gene_type:complete